MTSAIELCLAIRNGDCVQLRRLLRAGCDPDSLDYESRTALHLAAAEGDLKMVRRRTGGEQRRVQGRTEGNRGRDGRG